MLLNEQEISGSKIMQEDIFFNNQYPIQNNQYPSLAVGYWILSVEYWKLTM